MGLGNSRDAFWTALPWLAAIRAGVTGAAASAVLYAVYSKWSGRVWWSLLHLQAIPIYGDGVVYRPLGWPTLAGGALHILMCGLLALLFRALLRETISPPRTLLLGLLYGAACYYLMTHLVWKRWNPLLVLYAAQRVLFACFVALGFFLGRYPIYLRAAQRAYAKQTTPVAPPAADGAIVGPGDFR